MALSHFFAGRRPLPQSEAAAFLAQIGLTVKGEIDESHCFVFVVRAGLQDLAVEWIARLFPTGGVMVILSDKWPNGGRREIPPQPESHGVALYSGEIAAVVHVAEADSDYAWLPGSWEISGETSAPDGLLATEELPSKGLVRVTFQDRRTVPFVSWRLLQIEAEARGLSGWDVQQLIRNSPAPDPNVDPQWS